MSVDSKLFVVVEKERVLEVIDNVIKCLNKWVRNELDYYWKEHTKSTSRGEFLVSEDTKVQADMFTNGVKVIAYDMDMLYIIFGCGDENRRRLNVFPRDFHDYDHVTKDNKLVFSIGAWGKSNEIMRVVANACESFGDVYYDHNDCDEEDFKLIYDFSDKSSQFGVQ